MKTSLLFLSVVFLSPSLYAAYAPANRPYDVENYRVEMQIDPAVDAKTFEGQVTIRFKAKNDLSEIELDRDNLTIHQAHMGGKTGAAVTVDQANPKTIVVKLATPVKAKTVGTIRLGYKGVINEAHRGFFKVTDPDDPKRGPLLYTHFEPNAARAFFPCNDEPYDKATFETLIAVPPRYDVISNGKRLPDAKVNLGKNVWKLVQWKQDLAQTTYSYAVAIAPFGKLTDAKTKPELTLFVGEKKLEKAKYVVDVTRQSMTFFENYTGVKYPWAKYASVGIPTFTWGGMENTSATFMNEERMLLNDPNSAFERRRNLQLAAHELAHQWFGDLVTMKWWNDIWLNESFANYFERLATEHILKNNSPQIDMVANTWNSYFREENGPRSHPIVQKEMESADDAFDATTYVKGENVLRTLNFYIGEEKFKRAVKIYLTDNSYGNATYVDFFRAAETASGEKLSEFRDTWLTQRGYPIVTYGGAWKGDTKSYELKLSQRANHEEDKSLFRFRMPVAFHRKTAPAYDKTVVTTMSQANHTETVDLPAEPEWVSVNPGAVVLAKVEPADRDEKALAAQSLRDPDPVVRMWAAFELGNGLLEGKDISKFAEKSLAYVIKEDPSPDVRVMLLRGLQRMKTRWLPSQLGEAIFQIAKTPDTKRTVSAENDLSWSEYRSEILGTLGKVQSSEVMPFLTKLLTSNKLGLDDLGKSCLAVALQGDGKSAEVLKTATKTHQARGYRYKYATQFAFGALESTDAVNELRELTKTAGLDFFGRIGYVISDNQTLKNSKEWPAFLKEFVLTDKRFGDEVKSRLLTTIEEVKNENVEAALESIANESTSDRLKEASKKILAKNFSKG